MHRLLIAVLLGLAVGAAAMAQEPQAAQARTITVTGEARVFVKPDEAILTAGVSDESRDLSEAKGTVDMAGKAMVAAVRKAGVEEKDIQTDNLQIYLRDDDSRTSSFKNASHSRHFVVTREYRITLRNADKIQAVYDAVVAAGATSINGPAYQTSELRKYRDQARAMALKAAKEKATAMAKELGVNIGDVRTIREERAYMPWGANSFNNAQVQVQRPADGGAAEDNEGSTPLGQMEISANVEVVFDLVK